MFQIHCMETSTRDSNYKWGIYTPGGAVRQAVLTASKLAWYVSEIIENSCGPGAIQVAERPS